MTCFVQVHFKAMTIGQKIRQLREAAGMRQRELAATLAIGEGYLSKVENNQKQLKRESLQIISTIFNVPLKELETLWVANKLYGIIEKENVGIEALKVAEEQLIYFRNNENGN